VAAIPIPERRMCRGSRQHARPLWPVNERALVFILLPRIRYIFSINTGRSGSDYLHRIFTHVRDARSFHQPAPIGNGHAMRRYAAGDDGPMRAIASAKSAAIRDALRGADVYCESNHCFIKGFGWFMPHLLPEAEIGVIHLTRARERIVSSQMRIGCSPLTSLGREWVTTPDKRRPLVPPPAVLGAPRLTYVAARLVHRWLDESAAGGADSGAWSTWRHTLREYELACLRWYVDETNALADYFRTRFPAVSYVKADVDDLNSLDAVRSLLDVFGCQAAESISDCVGRPTNLMRP